MPRRSCFIAAEKPTEVSSNRMVTVNLGKLRAQIGRRSTDLPRHLHRISRGRCSELYPCDAHSCLPGFSIRKPTVGSIFSRPSSFVRLGDVVVVSLMRMTAMTLRQFEPCWPRNPDYTRISSLQAHRQRK